jgi:hypothetical protein
MKPANATATRRRSVIKADKISWLREKKRRRSAIARPRHLTGQSKRGRDGLDDDAPLRPWPVARVFGEGFS